MGSAKVKGIGSAKVKGMVSGMERHWVGQKAKKSANETELLMAEVRASRMVLRMAEVRASQMA